MVNKVKNKKQHKSTEEKLISVARCQAGSSNWKEHRAAMYINFLTWVLVRGVEKSCTFLYMRQTSLES